MKKFAAIGAIIIGIGVAIYYFVTKTDKNETFYSETDKSEIQKRKVSDVNMTTEDKEMVNLSSAKQEASSTIKERHEEAAQIIRESVEHIYEVRPESFETEESEVDEINAQLDDLLK